MDGAMGGERLLERDGELARLRELCGDAAAGRGSVVAVRGPAGLGKTALLDAARALGAEAGLLPLVASGAELERELAFGVVRQLFERPLRQLSDHDRDELLTGAPGLATTLVLEPEPTPLHPEAAQAAMHGLYWLAADLAARDPLLVVVDDAHWADAPSLRWLAYLARRLDGVPLLLITASRDAEPGAHGVLLEQVLSEAAAGGLRPSPLSRSGVERWLDRTYEGAPAPEFVEGCWSATGGNPLLLSELTAELRAEGLVADARAAARVDGIAPGTIARSVLTRLARLGPEAVAIAEAVAVLSQDARLDRVAALSGATLSRAAEIVDRLVASGIFADREPIAFAHPVLRAAVYEQIPAARRGLAHATAAWRLLDDGAGAERAASHLLLAPPSGAPAIVEALRVAAAAATARGAPDAAVQLLRRALAEPPAERFELVLELANAEAIVQDPGAVEHALEAVASEITPDQRARAAILAARGLTATRRFGEALDVLEDAERQLETLDTSSRQLVQAEALMQVGWHRGVGVLDERLAALGVDELAGETAGERALLAIRAMEMLTNGRDSARALSLTRRLLAHQDPDGRPDAQAILARSLALADAVDEARTALSALVDRGRERGAVASVAWGCAIRAETELRAGKLAEAETDASEALTIALDHDVGIVVPAVVASLVDTCLERRPAQEALVLLARHGFNGQALPPGYTSHVLLHARGRARAAAGDPKMAASDLRECGQAETDWGARNPAAMPWRSSLALVLHALGQTDEAEALAEEELDLARAFGANRAIGIALRAAALLRRGGAAIAGLREAVETLAASPAHLEHARALVDLGAAQRRAGRRQDALDTLRAGLDAADRCGAHQLSARARAELRAAGARPRRQRLSGPESLTASERRVAGMAAAGLTNRQIAQALFVTTKTVEMHLGRVYPKLGVAGRAELAGVLGEGQDRVTGAVASV
jgi:DNA-binding CsgD family transcriptional regulator